MEMGKSGGGWRTWRWVAYVEVEVGRVRGGGGG